jgi:predicted enzyme involved in methoxymalonyl-ACP biosynthesis
MHAVNVRAENVVLIDDNPVERGAICEQLPGVRVLGSHPYCLKRILLWSPETQQAVTTQEFAEKTGMARGQLERETARTRLSQQEFLRTFEPDRVDLPYPRHERVVHESSTRTV